MPEDNGELPVCTGEKGEGRNTFKPLHYLNTPIHRIVKGFIVQGGDFISGESSVKKVDKITSVIRHSL